MSYRSKQRRTRKTVQTKKRKLNRGGCGCSGKLFQGGKRHSKRKFSKGGSQMSAINNPVMEFGNSTGAQHSVDILSSRSSDSGIPIRPLV